MSERQRAEMEANAGKPATFDFRSAEQCRIDSAKEKKEIRTTFHQRGHLLAKAKAEAKAKDDAKYEREQSHSFRESLGGREW